MPKTDLSKSRAVIFSCAGTRLSSEEKRFFREEKPFGFILFARNVDNPDQLRGLIQELRLSVEDEDAPVLVDQEGGRVQRLRPPHWFKAPSFGQIGALYEASPEKARRAAELSSRLIAKDLVKSGFNVNCSPCLDMMRAETSEVVGDRSFGSKAEIIVDLASVVARTYMECGIMPVIKHMPGHGRARVDSHHELPVVGASLAELEETDFQPFKALADLSWGMTAHIVFKDLDKTAPATQSATVITEVIRGKIGFDGLLLTDDLNMNALQGDLGLRARRALDAGVDIVLHCSGKLEEMQQVAPNCPGLEAKTISRIEAGWRRLDDLCDGADSNLRYDGAAMRAELDALLQQD